MTVDFDVFFRDNERRIHYQIADAVKGWEWEVRKDADIQDFPK